MAISKIGKYVKASFAPGDAWGSIPKPKNPLSALLKGAKGAFSGQPVAQTAKDMLGSLRSEMGGE